MADQWGPVDRSEQSVGMLGNQNMSPRKRFPVFSRMVRRWNKHSTFKHVSSRTVPINQLIRLALAGRKSYRNLNILNHINILIYCTNKSITVELSIDQDCYYPVVPVSSPSLVLNAMLEMPQMPKQLGHENGPGFQAWGYAGVQVVVNTGLQQLDIPCYCLFCC